MKCNLKLTITPLLVFCIGVVGSFYSLPTASADIVLTAPGVAVVEDFNDFRGTGFTSTPASGQLDSDTYRAVGFSTQPSTVFGGDYDTEDFARGTATGSATEGGAYAFEVETGNFAVGVQPTDDDFTPGEFTIRIQNQTGQAINGVSIGGLGYFFNDTDWTTRWLFSGSFDDVNYTPPLFFLDSPGASDALGWAATPISNTVSFPGPLPNMGQFYIKITGDDFGDAGTGTLRDQFALDNFSVTAIPEPSSIGVLLLMMCPLLRRRR